MINIDVAALSRPIQTVLETDDNGDGTLIITNSQMIYLFLFDGAGHGYSAYRVAQQAIDFIAKHYEESSLCDLMLSLHRLLLGTIGGVAALCRFDKTNGMMQCTGIGNVTIKFFNPSSHTVAVQGGVLGYEISQPKLVEAQLGLGTVFLIHSDGVNDQVDSDSFPDFFSYTAGDIARIIIDYFSKPLDDASIIVMKVQDD